MLRWILKHHVVGKLVLAAALGIPVMVAVQSAVGAPAAHKTQHRARSQYPALLSHWALKRAKKNVDRTAWEYQLKVAYPGGQSRRYPALRPQDAIPGVKVTFNLPKGMNVKPAGKFKIRGSAGNRYVIVRSVRAGHSQTLKFWADPTPPNMAQRCFTATAQNLAQTGQPIANAPQQTAKACLPKAPEEGSGTPALYDFSFSCNYDAYGNCPMQNGVINASVALDGQAAGDYNYNYIPYQTTLSFLSGASFSTSGLDFSGHIHVGGLEPGMPKPTKADLSWYWENIQGQKEPQWTYRHVIDGPIESWYFTINVPGNPTEVCLQAVAQPLVWLPPKQTAHVCFVSS